VFKAAFSITKLRPRQRRKLKITKMIMFHKTGSYVTEKSQILLYDLLLLLAAFQKKLLYFGGSEIVAFATHNAVVEPSTYDPRIEGSNPPGE
jgi:hypothetical protein